MYTNDLEKTQNELIKMGFKLHHISAARGYVSRKTEGKLTTYAGRFGTGIKIERPRFDTSRYVYVEYWLK